MPPRNPPSHRRYPVIDLPNAVIANWIKSANQDWLAEQQWHFDEGEAISDNLHDLREEYLVHITGLAQRDARRYGGNPRTAAREVERYINQNVRNIPMPPNIYLPRGVVDAEYLGPVSAK